MVLTVKRGRVVEQLTIVRLRQSDVGVFYQKDWKQEEEAILFEDPGVVYVLVNGKTVYRKRRPLLDRQGKELQFDKIKKECLVECTYCGGRGYTSQVFIKSGCPVCKGVGRVIDLELAFRKMMGLFDSIKYIDEE